MNAPTPTVLPPHLPKRLAISFWLWNYYHGAQEGDHFHDLEQRIVELKERGFNTIRIDAGVGLCHTPDGVPRGPIELTEAFRGYSSTLMRQLNCRGGRCDVLKRLLQLFELAKEHDVYVILTSWFFLHTFWFVDDRIRQEMFNLPAKDRFLSMAREHDRLIGLLKERGLHTQIAFVEIANEFDGVPYWQRFREQCAGDEQIQLREFRRLHEEALTFLKDRHPDLLFACDTCASVVPDGMLPRNMQLWNHHMYYLWPIYGKVYEGDVYGPDFDFDKVRSNPKIGPFLRESLTPIGDIRKSARCDPNVTEDWYLRVWLYHNTDPRALGALGQRLQETLVRDLEEYRKAARDHVAKAVSIRDEQFPGLPLVVGEAATYCAHVGLRWEEQSDDYWSLVEYVGDLLKQNGYWGYMPRTNSGPEDPAWDECPERFRSANRAFLSP